VHWEWNADKVPTGSAAPKSSSANDSKKGHDNLNGPDSMQFDKSNIIMFGPTGSGAFWE
jgi:ATP-dependent protease Clp ATPase subunit